MNVNVDLMEKKCNSNQRWNKNKCRCECKKSHVCEKGYLWNTSKCICTNGKYLASIMSDSTITCDGIIESCDKEIDLNEKQTILKTHSFYILLSFLLIIITLLIAVSTNCYLIKYQAKNLLPFYNTKNKLNKVGNESIN